ncbi:hypothetical protein IFM89_039842 [Coptis chinensis]|uniref:Uncharacterized protein n=1 Tax=Coptis chinensis TaxID=261450 RepID=A0A835GSZ5_9MAGN|nr:hypothetical protein IFM89_039842 [Coptis chinensis]
MNQSLKSATFLLRSALLSHSSKSFSADALVPEYSRGEIGCVSGIPYEHLRRKAVFREEMLRRDIGDLQNRYQASERRCEELITQVPESTRPLLRQIILSRCFSPRV